MFSSQTSQGLTPPVSRGFSAVPSVASASAFVGIEGTAQNCVYRISRFLAVFCVLVTVTKIGKKPRFSSCRVSTTATNRHNCLTPDTQLTPKP